MNKNVGLILVVSALAVALWVAWFGLDVNYWLAPPHDKMNISWSRDVRLLEESGRLPPQWTEIKDISIRADNSPIQDWLMALKAPIRRNPNGQYRLDVFLIHLIEGNRYGAVIQYNLVDLRDENTIWEAGRTLKLGLIY
jgi:hypothetical protein